MAGSSERYLLIVTRLRPVALLMVSKCEREGFDGFIIDLCSDAEDETIRLVRLVADSEEGIMDDVFRLEYGSCEFKI